MGSTTTITQPSRVQVSIGRGVYKLSKGLDYYIAKIMDVYPSREKRDVKASFLLGKGNLYVMFKSSTGLTYVILRRMEWLSTPPPSVTSRAYEPVDKGENAFSTLKRMFRRHKSTSVTVSTSMRNGKSRLVLTVGRLVEEAVESGRLGLELKSIASIVEGNNYKVLLRLHRREFIALSREPVILTSTGLVSVKGVIYKGIVECVKCNKDKTAIKINPEFINDKAPVGFREYRFFNVGLLDVDGKTYFYFYDPGKRTGFITNDNRVFEDYSMVFSKPRSISEYVLNHPEDISYISPEHVPVIPVVIRAYNTGLAQRMLKIKGIASDRLVLFKAPVLAGIVEEKGQKGLMHLLEKKPGEEFFEVGEVVHLTRSRSIVEGIIEFDYKEQPDPQLITIYNTPSINLQCQYKDTVITSRRVREEVDFDSIFGNFIPLSNSVVSLEGVSRSRLDEQMNLFMEVSTSEITVYKYSKTEEPIAVFKIEGKLDPLPEVRTLLDALDRGKRIIAVFPGFVNNGSPRESNRYKYNFSMYLGYVIVKGAHATPAILTVTSEVDGETGETTQTAWSLVELDKLIVK